MDFDFSEDQQQLREAVRRWVDKAYAFERRRGIVADGGFARAVWAELADLGLTGLTIADKHGGLGMGAVEAMIAMEELGRGIVLEPLAQSFIAAAVLGGFAAPELAARWLPRVASGEQVPALAYQERSNRYHHETCTSVARADGAAWSVSGAKSIVPAGDRADVFLVPAMAGDAMALFLVERGAAGVTLRSYPTQDGSRAGELALHDAAATLVTREGLAALRHALDTGIALACAEGVGAMEQTLALTVGYMNTRKQFGVPIATFQVLRHRVADMKMQLELARSMSYYATLKLGAPEAERRRALAQAKYQLCMSLRFIGQQSVQLHGGMGVTDEYVGSHYFKKLTQLDLAYGDSLHHLGEAARRMDDSAGVFV